MKDTKIGMFYHNLTARFNGYFNAKEKMKEAEARLAAEHKDDFNTVISVFPTGGEAGAKAVAGDMDIIIKKCARVIKKHDISKWVDDCYFLIGKANYYKRDFFTTLETFQYVKLGYPDTEPGHKAKLWEVRTLMEMDKLDEAQAHLSVINNEKDFPAELKTQLYLVEADYFIRTNQYKLAVERLEKVIPETKKKNEKTRYMFVLAQLKQRLGEDAEAAKLFTGVIKKNPPYELSFQSKLKLAEVSNDKEEVKRYLENLIKDDKNISYFDQIYYVLAKLELKEGNTDQAIEYLKLSVRNSTENRSQKAISYITIADLNFERQNYRTSKLYYDSAANFVDKTYYDYANFKSRQTVLNDLISNLLNVQNQDSLQALAKMSPEELEKVIDKIIVDEQERMSNRQQGAQTDNINNNFAIGIDGQVNPQLNNSFTLPGQGVQQGGKGYFSNPTAMALGSTQFRTIWGERPLQDNWRRLETASNNIADIGVDGNDISQNNQLDSAALANIPALQNVPPDRLKYYAGIPFTEEQLVSSDEQIQTGLFNAGNIYYQSLNEDKRAAENFEELLRRYPDSKYKLQTRYTLYQIYSKLGQTAQADKHKNYILTNHPASDYAILIQNPEQMREKFANRERNEFLENLYSNAYNSFLSGNCDGVKAAQQQAAGVEKNYLKAKFEYLKLLCYGKNDKLALRDSLRVFIRKHPGEEVTKQAVELLDYLYMAPTTEAKSEANLNQGARDTSVSSFNQLITKPTDTSVAVEAQPSPYKVDFSQPHYYILIYPAAVNTNDVKVAISNYNRDKVPSSGLEISTYVMGNESQVLMVRNFKDFKDAMRYYKALNNQPGFYENLNVKPANAYVISNENYRTLMKERKPEEYAKFFEENYP